MTRVIIGLWGLMYITSFSETFINGGELTWIIILEGILGLALTLTALWGTKFHDPQKVTLNPEFIRTDKGSSYIRTAHWHTIDRITLTRFSIRIIYVSGTPERFGLPLLNSTTFTELKEWLQSKTDQDDIAFSTKPWWKPF